MIWNLGVLFNGKLNAKPSRTKLEYSDVDLCTTCVNESAIDTILLVDSKHIHDESESILLSFQANIENTIVSYSVQKNGFIVLNNSENEQTYCFELQFKENTINPFFTIKLQLDNYTTIEATAFGAAGKGWVAISSNSFVDAEMSLKYYLYEKGLVSIEEYEETLSKQYQNLEQEIIYNAYPSKIEQQKFFNESAVFEAEDLENTKDQLISTNQNSILASNKYKNGVNGVLQWTDDNGNTHPLEYVYVLLCDKDPTGEDIIASTYTNASGYYTFIFENQDQLFDFENGGLDIFIKVYSSGENIRVVNGTDAIYYWKSKVVENVITGALTTFNATFTMGDNLGRAFQISQASILASRYVKAMHGTNIADVIVRYPHQEKKDTSFYRRSDKSINIQAYVPSNQDLPQSYAAWDVIMHEYGHHVSYEFDIIDSPGDWHSISIDMAEHYRDHIAGTNNQDCKCTVIPTIQDCKDVANRLVWPEAWATVFGTMAQQFYPHPQIATVSDTSYTSYLGQMLNLDAFYLQDTESTERLVACALWNFFDATSDTYDQLSLGHQLFWKITTESKAKTFPQFMEYFNENINNVEYISLAAKINAYYNIAPRSFKVEGGTITKTAPTFTWSKISPQNSYYNTMVYKLVILDGNLNRIYESPKIAENSYTIPQQAWNSILETGNVIYATVYGGDNSLGSGFYCSEWLCFKNPNESITFNTYHRLIERTISLEQGEYADFYITFEGLATYDRVIQTFGNIDTTLTLFDENGNQIAYDDNNGYENNAQILLKQQNGKKYKVRVKFKDSSASGTTKLIIFIAGNHNGLEPTSFDNFLEISDSAILSTYMQEGGTYVYKFIPSESRQYTITTEIVDEENIQDMYLYLIDPRSTLNIVYDDDGGLEESQARIRINLEAGVPYLLIITRFNPDTSGGPAIVRIT